MTMSMTTMDATRKRSSKTPAISKFCRQLRHSNSQVISGQRRHRPRRTAAAGLHHTTVASSTRRGGVCAAAPHARMGGLSQERRPRRWRTPLFTCSGPPPLVKSPPRFREDILRLTVVRASGAGAAQGGHGGGCRRRVAGSHGRAAPADPRMKTSE